MDIGNMRTILKPWVWHKAEFRCRHYFSVWHWACLTFTGIFADVIIITATCKLATPSLAVIMTELPSSSFWSQMTSCMTWMCRSWLLAVVTLDFGAQSDHIWRRWWCKIANVSYLSLQGSFIIWAHCTDT